MPQSYANQFRLFLHAGAYWLLWSLRALMPRASSWRVAQFDTLRLRLIKVAARIVEPCMDASRPASAFFVIKASMVSCCHVSGLQCGHGPLASMRFAGRLPTIKSSSRLCGFPGFCRPTVRPSCHRVEDRPRSSWKLATPPLLG